MMYVRTSKHNKGFTLIEGLITLALVALLAIVGLTLYSFINNSVSIGDRQANLQSYARLAKITIEKRVVLSPSVLICSEVPTTDEISGTQKAIYVNGDGKLIEKSHDGTETSLLGNMPADISMSLFFRNTSKDETDIDMGGKLLGFSIISSCSGDTYQLDCSILNLFSANLNDGDDNGVAILYTPD